MVHEILPPQIGVCGRHRCFPVGDVGRRQQAFLTPLPGKAQIEVYRLVMNKIEIGIRLLNRLTWLYFLVFVDMKIG